MGKISTRAASAIRYGIERGRIGAWVPHPRLRASDRLLAFEAYLRTEGKTS